MTATTRLKLRVLFFLEYFVKGVWFPLLGLYLGTSFLNFTEFQKAWVFNCFALATLTGMVFGGQLADRDLPQERFLALSHLLGGLALFGLASVQTFWPFLALMAVHCFFYVPTLSVANALAFAHLRDDRRDFGSVRLFGTVGWVAAAWPLVFIGVDWSRVPALSTAGGLVPWLTAAFSTPKTGSAMRAAFTGTYLVAGAASLALAAFCLFLPHTPPVVRRGAPFAPLEAARLLARPSLLVLYVVTFFDSLVHNGYYFWASRFLPTVGVPVSWVAPAMSVGQVMEAVAMAFLGTLLKRLGWRNTMILGVLSQSVRFGVYSLGSRDLLWAVIAVNVVHGFAYACFFAVVYIYVDENFPQDVRSSAQSLFNLMILGISAVVSNFVWGGLGEVFRLKTAGGVAVIDFHRLFLVPFGLSILAAALLALFFHPPERLEAAAEGPRAGTR